MIGLRIGFQEFNLIGLVSALQNWWIGQHTAEEDAEMTPFNEVQRKRPFCTFLIGFASHASLQWAQFAMQYIWEPYKNGMIQ